MAKPLTARNPMKETFTLKIQTLEISLKKNKVAKKID